MDKSEIYRLDYLLSIAERSMKDLVDYGCASVYNSESLIVCTTILNVFGVSHKVKKTDVGYLISVKEL